MDPGVNEAFRIFWNASLHTPRVVSRCFEPSDEAACGRYFDRYFKGLSWVNQHGSTRLVPEAGSCHAQTCLNIVNPPISDLGLSQLPDNLGRPAFVIRMHRGDNMHLHQDPSNFVEPVPIVSKEADLLRRMDTCSIRAECVEIRGGDAIAFLGRQLHVVQNVQPSSFSIGVHYPVTDDGHMCVGRARKEDPSKQLEAVVYILLVGEKKFTIYIIEDKEVEAFVNSLDVRLEPGMLHPTTAVDALRAAVHRRCAAALQPQPPPPPPSPKRATDDDADDRASSKMRRCLEEDAACAICLRLLCPPLGLPCGHVFCGACIFKVVEMQGTKCPSCRKPLPPTLPPIAAQCHAIIDSMRGDMTVGGETHAEYSERRHAWEAKAPTAAEQWNVRTTAAAPLLHRTWLNVSADDDDDDRFPNVLYPVASHVPLLGIMTDYHAEVLHRANERAARNELPHRFGALDPSLPRSALLRFTFRGRDVEDFHTAATLDVTEGDRIVVSLSDRAPSPVYSPRSPQLSPAHPLTGGDPGSPEYSPTSPAYAPNDDDDDGGGGSGASEVMAAISHWR